MAYVIDIYLVVLIGTTAFLAIRLMKRGAAKRKPVAPDIPLAPASRPSVSDPL